MILAAGSALALGVDDYNTIMHGYPSNVQSAAITARIPYSLGLSDTMAWRLGYAHGLESMLELYDMIEEDTGDYVVNTNTDKFHKPSCYSVKKIQSQNRYDYHGDRDLLINLGFSPCQNCKP